MKKISFSLLLAFFALQSCTERIELELDTAFTKLVVDARLSTDTTSHRFFLSKTGSYFSNQSDPAVSNASVKLSYGNETIIFTEDPIIKGMYVSPENFFGIENETYNLLIENVDINEDGEMETYSAQSTMPESFPIDSIKLENVPFSNGIGVNWYYKDPEIQNFYVFMASINQQLISDTLKDIIAIDDQLFNGGYTNGIMVYYLDQEKETESLLAGDVVSLHLGFITKEYFEFISAAKSESFFSSPLFSGPPANVPTNMSNNALGFFTTISYRKASKTYLPTSQSSL